jgi:hypothetical protein
VRDVNSELWPLSLLGMVLNLPSAQSGLQSGLRCDYRVTFKRQERSTSDETHSCCGPCNAFRNAAVSSCGFESRFSNRFNAIFPFGSHSRERQTHEPFVAKVRSRMALFRQHLAVTDHQTRETGSPDRMIVAHSNSLLSRPFRGPSIFEGGTI